MEKSRYLEDLAAMAYITFPEVLQKCRNNAVVTFVSALKEAVKFAPELEVTWQLEDYGNREATVDDFVCWLGGVEKHSLLAVRRHLVRNTFGTCEFFLTQQGLLCRPTFPDPAYELVQST